MNIDDFRKYARILVDTREKNNFGIINFFNENEIKWKSHKLDFGDYSLEVDGRSYETRIIIERKGSLDELAGNLTKGRERFCREFERAHKEKCQVTLMIENGSWEKIEKHEYRSLFAPKAYEASLKTWSNKFMFDIEFVTKKKAGEFILQKLLQYMPF
jgi:ERCC4-type nuclease